MSSSFASASVELSSIKFFPTGAVSLYSLLNVQNNSKSQNFENQRKINEHILLFILDELCHRLINLGDFAWSFQVDSIKKSSRKNYK